MIRRFLKGIFTGGLIGFVLGVLFAPQKGDETRTQLKKFSDEKKPQLKKIFDTVKEKTDKVIEQAKENFMPEKE